MWFERNWNNHDGVMRKTPNMYDMCIIQINKFRIFVVPPIPGKQLNRMS